MSDTTSLVAIVASYSDRIRNGRTMETIYDSIVSETQELRFEIDAETNYELEAGPDGVFGEAIDVIASALDLARMACPELTVAEFERKCAEYMILKCDKWERKYG